MSYLDEYYKNRCTGTNASYANNATACHEQRSNRYTI